MKVTVTQQFECVPDGEVYPKLYKAGEIVAGNVARAALELGKGEPAGAANDTPPPAPQGSGNDQAPPAADAPPVVRAKLTRKHVHAGESYAKGLVVEDDLARLFIAEGVAEAVAPADKAVATVPVTK